MLKNRFQTTTKKKVKKVDRTRSKTSQIYITDTKDFSATIEEVGGKKVLVFNRFGDGIDSWYSEHFIDD